ncbi:hypothetical protein QGM71_13705 [Virgibacillus sp. C22-A2]|uniref:Uncharacterized protein n=1 Tax=Virgibacillus tibetensis TaxID=3042313 RepID=A0ABU6KGW8_9BACI|nr:hypothetical protein [Virgibacillus sp. C22-A2]
MSTNNKNPENKNRSQWNEEKRTPLDEMENQKFADDIPMEDLKIEKKEEKKKHKSKDASQSERKYKVKKDED